MSRQFNTNFMAYSLCEKDFHETLSEQNRETFFKSIPALKNNTSFANRIKNNLRSADQKLFLYDVLNGMNEFSPKMKIEADKLLKNLVRATDQYSKDKTMNDIDSFCERYRKELGKS